MNVISFRPGHQLSIGPEPPPVVIGRGKPLYVAYCEERKVQGWDEFSWEKLSAMQQIVWNRLAERLIR